MYDEDRLNEFELKRWINILKRRINETYRLPVWQMFVVCGDGYCSE